MTHEQRWRACWQGLGLAEPPAGVLADLRARYAEPHRHYHSLQHLDECLALLDGLRDQAERPCEVELALYYHDAVYVPSRPDNEAQSAELCATQLRAMRAPPDLIVRLTGLIMDTRHAASPIGRDAQLLVDIDLAILGAPRARFEEYEMQIGREYAAVPDALFRHGRAAVLKEFLARPAIYCTPIMRERLEAGARDNLRQALIGLGVG
ncbi:MAG: N-methyl-D-aspartate receptor NMDAR2C subunit [Rhodocyclaceae bacterium]|nr:N-methyl-D-aspartate receptor NMDAR2C subunit [Rhodocyclaceae bacterium]